MNYNPNDKFAEPLVMAIINMSANREAESNLGATSDAKATLGRRPFLRQRTPSYGG